MTLAAQGLMHRFTPEREVLSGVDVRLQRGEAVALLGPNGAGKTSLLRILAGVLEPTSGRITVDDQPLSDLSRREVAQRVSMVPQTRPPAFGFTALEFVLMGFHASARRFSLDGERQRAAALDALDAMAVAQFAARPMSQLSGGEAQRVTMARTLASAAPFWLLDEPTSNLDLRHQIALLDAVRGHCDRGGAALAIVHDPNLVGRWFDRVLVLADGEIAVDGAPREALTPEVFRRAFGLQMRWVSEADLGAWVPVLGLDPEPTPGVEESAS